MSTFYFTSESCTRHFKCLIENHLILTQSLRGESGESSQRARIRSRGKFHLDKATENFKYYAAMIVDTPIRDDIEYLFDCSANLNDEEGKNLVKEKLLRGVKDVEFIEKKLVDDSAV